MKQTPEPTPAARTSPDQSPDNPLEGDRLRKRRRMEDANASGGTTKLKRTAAGGRAASSGDESSEQEPEPEPEDDSEQPLYCICQQPYTADSSMVSCDACNEWFHTKCVGLSRLQARNAQTYHCPLCKSLRVRPPPWKPSGCEPYV